MSPESECPMNERDSDSIYEEQTHLAERELSSFIVAVTELYGPQQAGIAAKDWLDESDLMDSPRRSEARNWRAITIAAAARFANRVNVWAASAHAPPIYNLVIRYRRTIKSGTCTAVL